jgi:hypothetical protein
MYDEANDVLIVFGGHTPAVPVDRNDVWILANASQLGSGATWTQLNPLGTAPEPRYNPGIAYDPTSNRLILLGGHSMRGAFGDAWVLTHANGLGGTPEWLPLPQAPILRNGPNIGYDIGSNRLIVFGGLDFTVGGNWNDVWILTDANGIGVPMWMQLTPRGVPPSPRGYSGSVYDSVSNRLVVYGGAGDTSVLADLWVLTNANGLGGAAEWIPLSVAGGVPLADSAVGYDSCVKRAVFFGGMLNPSASTNGTWILTNADGTTGSPQLLPPTPAGTLPANRAGFAYGYATSSRRLVIGMGTDSHTTSYNDVWVLENALGAAVAEAGVDETVDEDAVVTLHGCALPASGADYLWEQIAGPTITLDSPTTLSPSFVAPPVASGSQTLTFRLTVTAATFSDSDTVNVTVRDVNHAPVAHAGADQRVNEGAPVALSGVASYDPDGEPVVSYSWVQTAGPPVVLSNPDSVSTSFVAPLLSGGSGDAVVLGFRLAVSDGLLEASDEMLVTVEQVNHPPVADAGNDQTRAEGATVALDGSGSQDPDGDALSFVWVQTGGPAVALSDRTTSKPTFVAPEVGPAGAPLTFRLTVRDGGGLSASDAVLVAVQDVNDPPMCDLAQPSPGQLWPPNHKLVPVQIVGVSDPQNDAVAIAVTGVTQNEPVNGLGDGDTAPDAVLDAGRVLLRAERSGAGNGRVYHVSFDASDGRGGTCSGSVEVVVPHDARDRK